jgi:hypothetical protein
VGYPWYQQNKYNVPKYNVPKYSMSPNVPQCPQMFPNVPD